MYNDERENYSLVISMGKERVLPHHDFPIKEMNQTPSSFRVMTWERKVIDGKEGDRWKRR